MCAVTSYSAVTSPRWVWDVMRSRPGRPELRTRGRSQQQLPDVGLTGFFVPRTGGTHTVDIAHLTIMGFARAGGATNTARPASLADTACHHLTQSSYG